MASTAKITATTLLTAGLVLALAGVLVPLGENWVETGSIRTTEVMGLFTHTLERSNDGSFISADGPTGWSDAAFEDDAGTGQFLAAGIVGAVSLLLLVVGTILTIPAKTLRAGGMVGVFGAVGVALTVALAVVGMRYRTEQVLGDANAVDAGAGLFLLAVSFLLTIVGAAIAATLRETVAARPVTNTWSDYPAHVAADNEAQAQADARARRDEAAWTVDAHAPVDGDARVLACPDCNTRTTAPVGVVPTCQACGFHRRDQPVGFQAGNTSPVGASGGWSTV